MAGRFFQSSPSPSAMIVTNTPAADLALTNLAYCCPSDLHHFAVPGTRLSLASVADSFVLSVSPHENVRPGHIGLNAIQRHYARVSTTGDSISVSRFVPPENFDLALLRLELELFKRGAKNEQVDAALLANQLRKKFENQVMTVGQRVAFEYDGNTYIFTVNQAAVEGQERSNAPERGKIKNETCIVFEASNPSGIKVFNQREAASSNIFKQKEFNLQSLGIGGLSVFPPDVISKLGIKVTKDDFLNEPQEIVPAFGASTDDLERCRLNGMVSCGDRHKHIYEQAMLLVEQVKVSKGSPLVTCLLEGPSGSGKTALAATVGIKSDFRYVEIVSAETMIGLHESTKCAQIVKVFEDAYKSPLSIIILDDLERLLEYVAIGPRFSNLISQMLVLLKRLPPKGKKLLVIGTTSEVSFLDSVGVCDAFSVTYHVPTLKTEDAKKVLEQLNVFSEDDVDAAAEALNDMPIKKLYMLIEMVELRRPSTPASKMAHFYHCLQDIVRY